MKTNQHISKDALNTAFFCIADVAHLTNEIVLTVENTQWLNSGLKDNRRMKIHSLAFGALFEIVKNCGALPKGYYDKGGNICYFIFA